MFRALSKRVVEAEFEPERRECSAFPKQVPAGARAAPARPPLGPRSACDSPFVHS